MADPTSEATRLLIDAARGDGFALGARWALENAALWHEQEMDSIHRAFGSGGPANPVWATHQRAAAAIRALTTTPPPPPSGGLPDWEQLNVQLAGCMTAAEGHGIDEQQCAKVGDYGWSPSYQATLELRRKYEALLAASTPSTPPGEGTDGK